MRKFFAGTFAFAPLFAHAVVATTSHVAPTTADSLWSYVGKMNGASAVAISPYVVLTAGHVGGGDFTLGDRTYHMAKSVAAPKISGTSTDLRVVMLKEALPGWYTIGTSVKKGAAVTMVGYGGTGVVNTSGTGYSIVNGGVRRAGGNSVSTKETTSGRGPTMRALLDSAGEAALVGGDSGGGWFSGSTLVGVSSFTYTKSSNKPAYGFAKKAYFGSGAVDLTNTKLKNWIGAQVAQSIPQSRGFGPQPVPEPGTLAVLVVGAGALLRRRRRA